MSVTMDLSEEISPLSVPCSYYSLNPYLQTPSSQLQFRSDLPLQKRPHVQNNQFLTEIAKSSTNFESILPDVNSKEGFCSSLNDLAGKDEATGDGGENDGRLQLALLKSRSGMDSQVKVSSNPEGPLSRLQDTVQEPNVVNPMEEEFGVKTTHSCSADTVLHEFGDEIVDEELAEILCRKKRKREIRDEFKCHFEDLVNKMLKKQEDMYKVLLETMEQKEKDRITRQETWRNLEMERMRKEEERRAQDTHRSLALLSLLEKFWGQQENNTPQSKGQQIIHIAPSPDIILPAKRRKIGEEIWRNLEDSRRSLALFSLLEKFLEQQVINNPGPLGQQEINTPQSTEQQIINIPQSPNIILHDQSRYEKWTKHEAQALISLRMAMEQKFRTGATKFPMSWEKMSLGMASMGFTKTAKHCQAMLKKASAKDPLGKWPKHEGQALISLRMAIERKFLTGATKFRMLWEEMSRGVASMGFTKTAKQCRDKWESMNWWYKRAERSGNTWAENAKTCSYFQDLDMMYKKGLFSFETAPEAETEAS
ncbi:hypothetical protein MKX03_024015 [Papaver bracteatum]|nr:hypothetical protein MKX03_024015 [Papaver bracteatum]